MTTGPGDEKAASAAGWGRLRASHADREQVIDTLKAAFVQGRLTKDELDLRVGQTLASRTYGELATLTTDIPAGRVGAQPLPKPARAQARPLTNKKVVNWGLGVCANIPPALLVVAFLTGNDNLFQAVVPMMFAYLLVLMIAGAHMLDSRLNNRSREPRGPLPPRPGQRGQALQGGQDGRIGNDLILSEARRDVRARHVPDLTARAGPARRAQRPGPSLSAIGAS